MASKALIAKIAFFYQWMRSVPFFYTTPVFPFTLDFSQKFKLTSLPCPSSAIFFFTFGRNSPLYELSNSLFSESETLPLNRDTKVRFFLFSGGSFLQVERDPEIDPLFFGRMSLSFLSVSGFLTFSPRKGHSFPFPTSFFARVDSDPFSFPWIDFDPSSPYA